MKKCNYCNTDMEDNISSCTNCGSKEFSNICNNCKTVFHTAFCPNCGVKAGEEPTTCCNCGNKSFDLFCPKCGLSLHEKGETYQSTPKDEDNDLELEAIEDDTDFEIEDNEDLCETEVEYIKKVEYQEPQKKKYKLKVAIILLIAIIGIGFFAKLNDNPQEDVQYTENITDSDVTTENSSYSTVPTEAAVTEAPVTESSTETTNALKAEPFETNLTAGYYTAGIDFPVGKYTFTAISGSGLVSTENSDEILEIMGTDTSDDSIIQTFKNVKMEDGVILAISDNLVLKVTSKNANVTNMKPRTNNLTETIELSDGNYTTGTDFPAGIYDIIAIKGSGNVYSSDSDGINEIMSYNDPDYVKEIKNIQLVKDVELHISGVLVQLIPSKSKDVQNK